MSVGRGRILKSDTVRVSARAGIHGGTGTREDAGRVEVVRENGSVRTVRVFCRCGEIHELCFEGNEEISEQEVAR